MADFAPTDEQLAIINAFADDGDLVIEAYAGAGKTATLQLLAESQPYQTGIFIAFNRSIAQEARQRLPGSCSCSTGHSLAFRSAGERFSARLGGPRVTAKDMAEALEIKGWIKTPPGRKDVSPWKVASLAQQTVRRYCYSADEQIIPQHVPFVQGLEGRMREVQQAVLPHARAIWADVTSDGGVFKVEHDHYMKVWQLSEPRLQADYVLVDEAQDTNACLAAVLAQQGHLQRVLVGDSRQNLFSWRGSINVMRTFTDADVLYLTRSFRFGEAVADEANRWLGYIDPELPPLTGTDSIPSVLAKEPLEAPKAILCRTNADIVDQAVSAQRAGKQVAIVGGAKEILALAQGAQQLQQDGKSSHPDLATFATWRDVVAYVEEEQPADNFATFVRLIARVGAPAVERIVTDCVAESEADLVVSTPWKVKGLEWDSVRVDTGLAPDSAVEVSDDRLMVLYVACTRAKLELDATVLSGFHKQRGKLAAAAERRLEQVPSS